MKSILQKIILSIVILLPFINARAQFESHLNYKTKVEALGNNEYNVKISCSLDKGWHVYSQFTEEGGPLPTRFIFEPNKDITLIGKVEEVGKLEKKLDELFGVEVASFANTVTFVQKVKSNNPKAILKGEFDGQVCKDEEGCMPFGPEKFTVVLNNTVANTNVDTTQQKSLADDSTAVGQEKNTLENKSSLFDWTNAENNCSVKQESKDKSIFLVFLFGFIGGLIALLTPCVFPMVPLTVSFFTKGGKDKKQGLKKALLYGSSIVVIYVLLGLVITSVFGSDALNALSTNVWFNLLFFVVFVIFAFSFFGFYEITLPSSWANKSDAIASKGGNLGIFFMAFTLALVSFSCTGPIIGTLLVEAATGGGPTIMGRIPLKPLIGMLGFSSALALPFTLFALFPQWLQSLPKSGGWMNTVKVVLGFIELALALKFLSVADMTMHWNILKWEPFLIIWIILFIGLALYLFGIIKFPHDSKEASIGVVRKILGVIVLLFVAYLSYGLFSYTPLKLLSGLAPPVQYNFKNKQKEQFMHFKDFEEGRQYAANNNLPILLDFTGFGCVNCRKIEENVWTNQQTQALLSRYVVISLYVDDRAQLPQEEWYTSSATGIAREIKTVGQKWSDFQAKHFKTNSQPYYVLTDSKNRILNQAVDYSFSANINNYNTFLTCGLEQYQQLNP